MAAGLAALAAVAAVVVFLSARGGGVRPPSGPVSSVSPNTLAVLDPANGALVSDGAAGSMPGPMAVAGGTLWVGSRGNAQIGRFFFRAGHGTRPLQLGAPVDDLAVDGAGHVWVSDRKPFVTWVSHVSGGIAPYAMPAFTTQRIPVSLPGAGAEAIGGGYLWVISDLPGRTGRSVALVDVGRRRFVSAIALGRQTTALAYGYGYAWIGGFAAQDSTAWLVRVRPGSTQRRYVELESQDGAGPLAVAVGEGSIWVITSRGNLLGIDPRTLQIAHRIPMSAKLPTLLAVGGGSVWTTNHQNYSVSQVDPRRDKIVHTTPLGSYRAVPCGLAATHDAVFVTIGETTCA
jgi:hypothetical protein